MKSRAKKAAPADVADEHVLGRLVDAIGTAEALAWFAAEAQALLEEPPASTPRQRERVRILVRESAAAATRALDLAERADAEADARALRRGGR